MIRSNGSGSRSRFVGFVAFSTPNRSPLEPPTHLASLLMPIGGASMRPMTEQQRADLVYLWIPTALMAVIAAIWIFTPVGASLQKPERCWVSTGGLAAIAVVFVMGLIIRDA